MNRLRPRPGALAALFAAAALAPEASASRLPFRLYQASDGLPKSQVLAIHQDRRAELWIGTWCGAARFDGAQFSYVTQRSGLPSNYVRDFGEDSSGRLWLAAGNGVARLDPADPSRPALVVDPLIPSARPSAVRDVFLDSRDTLWGLTQSDGIAHAQGTGFVAVPVPEVDLDGFQLVAEEPAGTILVGTREGVFAVEGDQARPWQAAAGPWHDPIRLLYSPAPGELLLATAQGVFKHSAAGLEELHALGGGPIPLAHRALRDRTGRLWIGTDSGLYQEAPEGFIRLGVDEGLPDERLYAIFEDREGNLWFGTDSGMVRLSGDAFRTFPASARGIPPSPVWGLGLDDTGALVAGTTSGLLRLEGDGFKPLLPEGPLRGKTVRAVVADRHGGFWAGTADDGILHWDGRAWTQLRPPQIPDARVFAAFVDSRGDVWFGTRRGVVRIRDGKLDVWTHSEGLLDDTVWQIAEDPRGRVVVATDRGLAAFDGQAFSVPTEFARFSRTAVRNVVFRKDGSVWVGTNGYGLAHFEGGKWTDLLGGQGPADDFVWGLVEDARQRLWVATNRGVDLFDGRRWVNFSVGDGLPDNEIAVNAMLALADGSVALGFVAPPAVVRFSPTPLGESGPPPVVRVTGLATEERSLAPPLPSTLPWSERDLTFSYIGISFRDERRVRYRTRLEGYDPGFGRETSARSVRYTNLPPGRYRFQVLAASAGGVWSPRPVSVDVEILAPFWRRTWFAGLTGLSLLGGFALLGRRHIRALAREKDRLESLVAERTRSLQEQVTETERLKQQYEQLSVTDPLTGIANRRSVMEQLDREVIRSRRHTESLGLLVIDVDGFKEVNDRHGHQAGDRVLTEVAATLAGAIRRSDVLGRYGGEEFVIAFLSTDRAGCLEASEGLRRRVAEKTFAVEGGVVRVTFSGGLVWHDFASGDLTLEELIRRADLALYRAKASGKNRIEMTE